MLPAHAGVGLSFCVGTKRAERASPHAGGSESRSNKRSPTERVKFPAHAGVTLTTSSKRQESLLIFRTRGGGSNICDSYFRLLLRFPHAREWPCRSSRKEEGRTHDTCICRDGPESSFRKSRKSQRFQHTRGWLRNKNMYLSKSFTLPARAGVALACRAAELPEKFVSRMRGVGSFCLIPDMLDEVCYPHTRGWVCAQKEAPSLCQVLPAHAGVTLLKRGILAAGRYDSCICRSGSEDAYTNLRKSEYFPHMQE